MNNIIFDHYRPSPHYYRIASKDKDFDSGPSYASWLFGPTCESIDVILENFELPGTSLFLTLVELLANDWMYFANMGAYTNAGNFQV